MFHLFPGTPGWVELYTPDVEASAAFYSSLFGWKADEEKSSARSRLFFSGEKMVAGVRSLPGTQITPQWVTCISTDDRARTVRLALDAGGKMVMEAGRGEAVGITLIQDTVGAVFGIFQQNLFGGAHLFNQPVSLTFNLLMTRQPDAAKQFYTHVFGWEPRDREIGGMAFTYFFHRGRGIAGVMAMDEHWEHAIPSHWQTSFSVDDADVLASRAVELGGKMLPVLSTPFGRSGLLTDPQGAMCSLSQQTPEVRAAVQTPEGVLAHLV